MLVRDVMTTNVVTIPSNTPVLEARKIMETHRFRRLPVVDKGKLVGIVTKNITRRSAPSEATSLSVWEISYLIAKMTVKEVMKKEVVTVSPDTTVEQAVAIAQSHGISAMPVMEDKIVVGIVTTNDLFYKLLNPLLGINESGRRFSIYGVDTPGQVSRIMDILESHGLAIKAMHTITIPEETRKDLVVHLDTEDIANITLEIQNLGFKIDAREHQASNESLLTRTMKIGGLG